MKTKIIATYGPAIEPKGVLSSVLKHIDVVRINFSHANEQKWLESIDNVRTVSKAIGKEVALLADLPGPKMRLGDLGSGITVKKSEELTFRYGKKAEGRVQLDCDIKDYLKKGSIIILGDGYLSFSVDRVSGSDIVCRALNAGTLTSRKGINIKHGNVTAAPPTAEDVKLAKFAKKNDFDMIALSFVRSAENVRTMRNRIGDAFIISKIERAEAVKKIDSISQESDAIMVARGDLAFEVDIEEIPIMQARIIKSARKFHKPVIVATQMLLSMVNSPMPTRAEVNDIATGVLQGADCLMMSEETAVGKYPVETVRTMATTARNAEEIAAQESEFKITTVEEGVAYAAKELSDKYGTECIFVPTESGHSAMSLSGMRPRCDIMALSRFDSTRRKLALFYGVRSGMIGSYESSDQMMKEVRDIAKKRNISNYIVLSGIPHRKGSTRMLQYIRENK